MTKIITEKKCSHCQRVLPTTEFIQSVVSADGYYNLCDDCRKERAEKIRQKSLAKRAVRFWECDMIARPDKDFYKR